MQIPNKNMAIIDRYDGFFNYIYPIASNISRKHGVLKLQLLDAVVLQYRLFHDAAKTNQKSRLYLADSNMSFIKEILRIMVNPSRKMLSRKQHETASILLSEPFLMLNKWISRAKG